MQKLLGVVMDPIERINPKKDSTLAILLEAQRRDWSIFYMQPSDLFLEKDIPWATMRPLMVQLEAKNGCVLGENILQRLDRFHVILMRKDPPVTMHYIYATQLLDKAEKMGVLVVNKPQSLRDFNEKLLALQFPSCCPPTLITASIQAAKLFLEEHEDMIVKPLYGMGGFSVFRLRHKDPNLNVTLELLSHNNRRFMVVQRYIPEITQGDKRILLINGEPVPYALARLPAPGETRANLASGGTGLGISLSDHDRWICAQVGPVLREKGLILAGLDVIGDYLTEINITSPTGIRELDKQFNTNISARLLDYLM